MASNQWIWAMLFAWCVTVNVSQAQYGTPSGAYPPNTMTGSYGHGAPYPNSYGVTPPLPHQSPAYIAPQQQYATPPQTLVNAYGAATSPPGYQVAMQGESVQPLPVPGPTPVPNMAPPVAAPPPAQPSMVEVPQGTPVYGGAPSMNYRDVAQGYVHEAMTNYQPAPASTWAGAQFGHAHRGCGPTYPVWGCDDGSCRPQIGERLKGRVVGDAGIAATCGAVTCGAGPRWFASAYGLLMRRSKSPFYALSEDTATSAVALSATSWNFPYQGGVEVRFGKYLNPELAVEGAWWTLFEDPHECIIYAADYAGGLSSRVDYSALDIVQGGGPAANVQGYYDGAWMHRLRKSFSLTNVEFNVLQIPICGDSCSSCSGCDPCGAACAPSSSRINLSWHVGARYLRLDEDFEFATDFANGTWGDGVDEVFHCIDMENHLVGTQAGGHMFLPLTCRLSLFTNASVGVFNNHMRQNQRVFNADGWAYVNAGPYTGQNLQVRTRDNHAAVMGELRTGIHCQFTQRWRGTFIYRTMGLANVALPEHQIPTSFADLADVRRIRGNGSVVLHGFMFGLETRF